MTPGNNTTAASGLLQRLSTGVGRSRLATLIIVMLLAILAYGRIRLIRDVVWDDNGWLLSVYASGDLWQFLNTGFVEARRIPLGVFTYGFLGLHRDTAYFYLVWDALNLLTIAATPLLLYLTLRELFPDKQRLALLATLAFIVFPLDYTLPYASGINYRLGLLSGLASLYLTTVSVAPERVRPVRLGAALAAAAISYYVFLEAAVAFEPARLYLIARRRHDPAASRRVWTRRTLTVAAWFALACAPLIVYKLAYKTYGIYAGIYGLDPAFLLRFWDIAKAAGHFVFSDWFILARHFDAASGATYLAGALGAGVAFVLLRRLATASPLREPEETRRGREMAHFLALALLLALPPALLFHAFNRPISWGMNSTHAVLSQAGYAMLLGAVLCAGLNRVRQLHRPWLTAAMALWIGTGIFFSNLNTDQYRKSWVQQDRFWRAFVERFPALPERATFFFDVQDGALYSDLVNYYDFEFQLNLLYATSAEPAAFRRYKAYTAAELMEPRGRTPEELLSADTIERLTHLGPDRLQPAEFIVVRYRNGKLLVNREITRADPGVSYGAWADKSVPIASSSPASYPLRGKLEFAY
ncbi:MAG: hypothetical protein EPN55_06885 [Gammaproteobacteria bacterium]|nr:MAG: hypothetical protein EPN55_06885 [Gammaproteobacteria bacterium]